MTAHARPTVAEIDLGAIRHNVSVLHGRAPDARFCAVVKADGYGHGAVPVARAALDAGASWLAVALIEEGEVLRSAGIDVPILVLSEPPSGEVDRLLDAALTATVYREAFGDALDAAAGRRGEVARAHVKADTGMGRVGAPEPDWNGLVRAAAGWDHVEVEALWTHLARADEPGVDTTDQQLDAFARFEAVAANAGLTPAFTHTANSAATMVHPRAHRGLVRVGIAMYGLSPSTEVTAQGAGLRPAMRVATEVSYVKHVPAGTPVSYGHTWRAPEPGWLATLPVGYADGVPRLISNRADVLIGGRRCRIAGNVCMDQTVVWCGDHAPTVGDEVVLIGSQGDEVVRAEQWADIVGTITYEIACGISSRVPRLHRG